MNQFSLFFIVAKLPSQFRATAKTANKPKFALQSAQLSVEW